MEQIFHHVLIPQEVARELTDPSAPETVSRWMTRPPAWIEIRAAGQPDPDLANRLDRGEAEAIQLAIDLRADFLLIDEVRGRKIAITRGPPLEVMAQLRASGFHVSSRLVRESEERIGLIARIL